MPEKSFSCNWCYKHRDRKRPSHPSQSSRKSWWAQVCGWQS